MIKAFVLSNSQLARPAVHTEQTSGATITTQSHSSKGGGGVQGLHSLHKSDIDTSCFYRKSSSCCYCCILLTTTTTSPAAEYMLLSTRLLTHSNLLVRHTYIYGCSSRPPKVNDIPGSKFLIHYLQHQQSICSDLMLGFNNDYVH